MRLHELSVAEEIEASVIKAFDEGWKRAEIRALFTEYLNEYDDDNE